MRAATSLLSLFLLVLHLAPIASAQSVSFGVRRGLPAPTALARSDYDATHGVRSEVTPPSVGADADVQPPSYAKSRSRRRKLSDQGLDEREMPLTNAERLRRGLPLKAPEGIKARGEEEEVVHEAVAEGVEQGGFVVAEQP